MPTPSKVAIIGVGLLGGSLALALRKQKGWKLAGWNHRASSRRKAAKILPVAPSFEKAVQGADVILLCSHSGSISPVLRQAAPFLRPETLVMDVSSVKGAVVGEASRFPEMARHFVPCHPMAGKEKSGVAFADGALYRGKIVFVTPLPRNPQGLVRRAVLFWKNVGARPVILDAVLHDRYVALTSHLPHLLASAMMHLYGTEERLSPRVVQALGTGFRDFTRIAAGNPAMWNDIMRLNASEITSSLSKFRALLNSLERRLRKGDGRYWTSFFEKARDLREKL